MGVKVTNQTAQWKIQDVTIEIDKYSGSISTGQIIIIWNKTLDDREKKFKADRTKSSKDF